MNSIVSCVIPSYKRADTLRRAIDSVLAQTYEELEVLVVDDNIAGDEYCASLRQIIDEYKEDSRVRLVTQPMHINGAEARNAGVRAAHGDYIAFLDDDDEWLPTKIENQMKVMLSDNTIDGIAGGATLWAGGKEVSKWQPKKISEIGLQQKVLIREVRFATSTFLCKKKAFEEMQGFNPSLKRSQDLQLFADFLSHHRIYPMTDIKTTKMHTDSAINRLDSKKLSKNKKEFFTAISEVMDSYTTSQRRRIKSAHYYEIAFIAAKEKKYFFALRHILMGLKSPSSLIDLYRRFRER